MTVGNSTDVYVETNQEFGRYGVDDFDRAGKEIKVAAYATSVGLYRSNWLTSTAFSMRWLGIFTTATDCTGAFVWTLPTSPLYLAIGTTT